MWLLVKPYLNVTESCKIYRYLGAKNIMTKAKTNVFYLLKRKFMCHGTTPAPMAPQNKAIVKDHL